MEPFDLERAKAGDPIELRGWPQMDIRFSDIAPDEKHISVWYRPRDNDWRPYAYRPDELCMKPKPTRFWVRPWKYKGGSVPAGLLWWPEEQKQPNNVSEDGTWEWAGEAKLVEWP